MTDLWVFIVEEIHCNSTIKDCSHTGSTVSYTTFAIYSECPLHNSLSLNTKVGDFDLLNEVIINWKPSESVLCTIIQGVVLGHLVSSITFTQTFRISHSSAIKMWWGKAKKKSNLVTSLIKPQPLPLVLILVRGTFFSVCQNDSRWHVKGHCITARESLRCPLLIDTGLTP